jgi:hypothetical protein
VPFESSYDSDFQQGYSQSKPLATVRTRERSQRPERLCFKRITAVDLIRGGPHTAFCPGWRRGVVSHLTKTGSANRKHRVLGSIAYVGACRANHLFVADPRYQAGRRVLMLDNGGNVAPLAPALAYTIEERDSGPRIEWSHEPVSNTIGTSFKPAQRAQHHYQGQAARHHVCDHWLRAFLAERHRSTTDIFEAATDAGFSKDQVRRAKSRIGAVAQRVGFHKDAQWNWALPVSPSAR